MATEMGEMPVRALVWCDTAGIHDIHRAEASEWQPASSSLNTILKVDTIREHKNQPRLFSLNIYEKI